MTQTSPWRRGAVEAGFILFSILLAFWIDAWWDDQQDVRMESAILVTVEEELGRNRVSLDAVLSFNGTILDRIDRFLRAAPSVLAELPSDSVLEWARAITIPPTFDPEMAAATLLLDTPIIDSSSGIEVRTLVARWLRSMQDAEEEKAAFLEKSDDVLDLLAPYVVGGASEGRLNIPPMFARMGTDVLAQIRADEQITSAVLLKGHWQAIYVGELEDARLLLDSLSAMLGTTGNR